MTKSEFINDVACEMQSELDKIQLERLKVVMIVKLHDYELSAVETLPSTEVHDNEYIMKRYSIDMIASGREKSTIEQYLIALRKFFNETGLSYIAVTGQDITDYLAIRQFKDGISQSYKSTLLSYLSNFFKWAYRKHHIETDIMRDVDRPKHVKKKKDRLTDEEVARCRSVARTDVRERALVELMLSAGPRVSEIVSLNIENVDFRNDEIKLWGEKTNEYRTVYLSQDCKLALKEYIGDRTSGAVFIGTRGRGRMCENTIEEIAKSIAKRAECHCKATVHIYRKTFASIAYRKTGDVLLVSKMLGHASTDVTIQCYLVDDIEEMKYKLRKVS